MNIYCDDSFLAIHPTVEGEADPYINERGLKELTIMSNLLMQFDIDTQSFLLRDIHINAIAVGIGTRFEEMFLKGLCTTFSHIKPEYFDFLGNGVSRMGNKIITPMGTKIPEGKHHGISKCLPPRIVWDYILKRKIHKMKPMGGHKLSCTGREFVVSLGAPREGHYGNSILRANVKKKTLEWIVKHGYFLEEPEPLPLKIF